MGGWETRVTRLAGQVGTEIPVWAVRGGRVRMVVELERTQNRKRPKVSIDHSSFCEEGGALTTVMFASKFTNVGQVGTFCNSGRVQQ